MRHNFGIRLWMAALVLFLMLVNWPVSAEEKKAGANDKVAVVNGDVITRGDLDRAVDFGKTASHAAGAALE